MLNYYIIPIISVIISYYKYKYFLSNVPLPHILCVQGFGILF